MPSTKLKNMLYRSALPFCSPSPGRNPLLPETGHRVNDLHGLSRIIRRHHVLGGAFLISDGKDCSIVFERPFSSVPSPDADSYFRVASITKMATALLSLLLVHDGLLDPDAPIASYLPESDGIQEIEGVSLRHLLSHTSGISDPPGLEKKLESGLPYRDAVSGARFSEPGTAFRYSNLGFGLVGCMMEYITGIALGSLFASRIFIPLGMNASIEGCALPENRIMPVVRVLPYHPEKAVTVTPLGRSPLTVPDPLRHYGHTAGSMYTDIRSLYRLLLCIRDNGAPLVPACGTSVMKEIHAAYGNLSPSLSYGLGLLIINDSRLSPNPVMGHQGFAYGCADGAFWEENTGRVMIILNSGCSEAREGRLGLCNRDMLRWTFQKELSSW